MRSFLPLGFLSLGLLVACAPPEHLSDLPPSPMEAQTRPAYGAPLADPSGYGAPAANQNGPISSDELNSALFGGAPAPQSALPATDPLAAGGAVAMGSAAADPAAVDPVTGLPVAAPPMAPANEGSALGISDTQNFAAVTSRETIEENKARLEANKANYVQIQPAALPEREKEAQVSIVVSNAVNAPNRLNERIYERGAPKPEVTDAACMSFTSEEKAQETFLAAGGPKRDPKRLDPDGDGFACKFDPTPYQAPKG